MVIGRRGFLASAGLALPLAAQAAETAWDRWRAGGVRAVNVLTTVTPGELEMLRRDWGLNALRVQLELRDEALAQIADGGLAANPRLERRLRELFDSAGKRGLGIVFDLHRAPGGSGPQGRLWQEAALQDQLVKLWGVLARDLRGHPALWGHDLLNEPTPPDEFRKPAKEIEGTLQDWNRLARRLIAAVRAADAEVPLVVESTDWAKPGRFRTLAKFDDPRVVYSFHMYAPFPLTHQGINQFPRRSELRYPGAVDGEDWNLERLRRQMEEPARFVARHGVPVFVGEFGINARADAESRARYVADLLALFAEQRWSWAYHAHGIWDGWAATPAMVALMKARAK